MLDKRLFAIGFVAALSAGACSHEVESPKVSLSQVEPNLVCNDNRVDPVAPVRISGLGFDPMPTNVLSKPPRLVLPTVELGRTQDLMGEEQNDPATVFSGYPNDPLAGNVTWSSAEQLTIRVTEEPAVDLEPGLYDVTVTNPDKRSETISDGLVVVPPPLVSEIIPPAICVDQADQTIQVVGQNFATVDGTNPMIKVAADGGEERTYEPDTVEGCMAPPGTESFGLQLCDTMTFTVPQGDLPVGKYTLTVTDPEPLSCFSSEDITLTVNPPPRVDSVAPATVCTGGSILVASGEGFIDGAMGHLECADSGNTVESTAASVNDDGTEVEITFGAGIKAGETCDVIVQNPDGCEDRPLPHQTVVGTEGPILFNVDPNVAYNGINTKVTLYVTALEPPFTVSMWPDGDMSGQTDLTAVLAPGKTKQIQATIPKDTAPGSYTIGVNDNTGCLATLDKAVVVTDQLVVENGSVTPPFGQDDESTPITIVLGSDPGAMGTPRGFLNPPGDDPAIQLQSLTVTDATTLTAVVPAGTPTGTYDLVIVWPDENVAVLTDAYTSVSEAPPVIDDVVPQSIVDQSGQSLEVRGTGFDGAAVSLRCDTGGGETTVEATSENCSGGTCTATVDGSGLSRGDVCVVRVTRGDTYGEFSAIGITNSSFNLSAPAAGQPLNVGRRALVSSAVKASSAARFVYAIGGDDGSTANAFDSVELAPVDVFGKMSPWAMSEQSLGTARSFSGSATLGRYIYVFGGNDGGGALATAERALVLSPEEIPTISSVDLCLAGADDVCFGDDSLGDGLAAGVYSYRVAAVIDSSDPVNLGGETLASDPIIFRLRNVQGRSVVVKLTWDPPVDAMGDPLSGVTGYRVYRTPKDGVPGTDEVLLTTVDAGMDPAASLEFIDDGTEMLGSASPLPLGSTSDWQALPSLNTAREGVAGAVAVDPSDASTWYVYALLGRDGSTGHTTYEYLDVSTSANGRQAAGSAWTTGAEESAYGRWQHGAWTVDNVTASIVDPGDTYVYLGAGLAPTGNTRDDRVEAARVTAGGELSGMSADFPDDPTASDIVGDFSSTRVGYGTAAAAGRLFVFGGRASQVRDNATAAEIVSPAPSLANNAWNNEGLTMTEARYLMGSSIQSAFIFLVGGDTGSGVTTSTETVVW